MLQPTPQTSLEKFATSAAPYSHWGAGQLRTRLNELKMLDGMFPGVMRGDRALDVGCGIGFACAYLSSRFASVEGTDIEELGVAFNVDRPSPIVGRDLLRVAGIENVSLHCGDTFDFLDARPSTYDFILSVFVMEHVEGIDRLCAGIASALKPGGKTIHIVPNTHDTIIQLLVKNLSPIPANVARWAITKLRRLPPRAEGRLYGTMFAPITHSEFVADYRKQFEVNALERYAFPLIEAGLTIRDVKPVREHSYAILAERVSEPQ